MARKTRLCLTFLLTTVLAVPLAFARTWTDRTGGQHLDAELVDVNIEGTVFLNPGGPVDREIDIKQFSDSDQRYIEEELRRRRTALVAELSDKPGTVQYGPARKLCTLANQKIKESSGVACSRRHPGIFWTHNDSGDDARLYAFDLKGRDLGSCLLEGVQAFDWEDIASLTLDGKPCLLVGDIGNNSHGSAVQILYLIEEPPLDLQHGVTVKHVPVLQTINFSYDDDNHDCESLGVDVTSKTILLVSKERWPPSNVYALPWPENNPKKAFVARKISQLKFPLATGMDVSPDGRRAVVGTYRNAYEFTRGPNEDWATAFSRKPAEIILPPRIEGEGICYGPDGKTLYLTSEKLPTPLWEVPVQEARP